MPSSNTTRSDDPGSARAGQRGEPPTPDPALAVYVQFEQVVGQLARLALHAHALAERQSSLPPAAPADPARAERIRRLHAGADLARRALTAATRLDLTAITGTGPGGAFTRSQTVDRRSADRRVTARPPAARTGQR